MNITELKKEYMDKFVEPADTDMRVLNLNNEKYIVGATADEVWSWIESKLSLVKKEAFEEGRKSFIKQAEKIIK